MGNDDEKAAPEATSPDRGGKKPPRRGMPFSPPHNALSSNPPRPPAINGHNRDITEHTASLMSLFARPPSPPKTPITPNLSDTSNIRPTQVTANMLNMPPMPYSPNKNNTLTDEERFQLIPLISRSSKNGGTSTHTRGSFIANMDSSLKDTMRVDNRDLSWHNRDETLLSKNLSGGEKDPIEGAFACTPTRGNNQSIEDTAAASLLDLVTDPNSIASKDYATFSITPRHENSRLPFLKAISESQVKENETTFSAAATDGSDRSLLSDEHPENQQSFFKKCINYVSNNSCDSKQIKSTLMGAILYSLYALVFCFAEASAITRPSHPNTAEAGLLAPMALMGSVSTLVSAPLITYALGGEYSALYPCLDMFLAPFLAKMAADVDVVLVQMRSDATTPVSGDKEMFLATFVALNASGMLLSGLLCILACKVKLANLAGFLPYPVLCGFFSSVGISVWMSSFKVDTGMAVPKVISSRDWGLIQAEFTRHAPSLVAGTALYNFGPKNIWYLIAIISSTVCVGYFALFVTNHSLEEAQEMGYFWKSSEVVMANQSQDLQLGWGRFGPPAPLGLLFPSPLKYICWPAFLNGLDNVIAMSIIYMLRCSLHAAALSKNDRNIKEIIAAIGPKSRQRSNSGARENDAVFKTCQEPKRSFMSVLDVLNWYAYSLLALVFSGGFAVLPTLSLGGIFARINAHTRLPQFVGVAVLFAFYLSEFRMVSYVPKFTFSSLLVMAAIDLINTWFIKSYKKTTQIYEWLVIPSIVALSLLSGMLQALGLGVCISTFIFIAQFYRSGVVKFVSTGLAIRSSIERNVDDNNWLDTNGDLIQVLVLQNYLYFGNATSCLHYISTMFDDCGDGPNHVIEFQLPPIPKYILLDMSIVTGIDTSAVDIMVEISSLCKANCCCLVLSGIPSTVKSSLVAGGLTPSRQYHPHLFFMDDLDSSLGKAEDDLLNIVALREERLTQESKRQRHQRITSMIDNGMRYALRKIDEQHDLGFSKSLAELELYALPRDLEPGELLNESGSESLKRGLYFIESGLIKCSVDASASLTRGRQRFESGLVKKNDMSLSKLNARSGTIARHAAVLKNSNRMNQFEQTFRLGRFGPGWVIGTISEFTGQDIPGAYQCVTPCRVHHLTFDTIEELEVEKPALILNLYKMLAHLMARRQEMTIGQLSTFKTIMSSNVQTKPPSRRSIIAINKTIQSSV